MEGFQGVEMVGVARIELATPAMSTLDRGPKTPENSGIFCSDLAKVTPKTLLFAAFTAQSQRIEFVLNIKSIMPKIDITTKIGLKRNKIPLSKKPGRTTNG